MTITLFLCGFIYARKASMRTEDLIMLPKQKEEENREELDQTITSTKDAVDFSERVYAAGMNMGLTKRDTMLMSLCVEELACYTIEKGFQDKKKHSIDARVAMTDKAWTISLRDDCKPMNPQEQLQIFKPEDEMDNIGLVVGFAIAFVALVTIAVDAGFKAQMRTAVEATNAGMSYDSQGLAFTESWHTEKSYPSESKAKAALKERGADQGE